MANEIKIISDINECEKLWREFSPNESLFDLWEYRYALWQAFKYPLHFLLLRNENKNLALLPLWFDTDEKEYAWIASSWPEDNKFFCPNPNNLKELLAVCPRPAYLYSMCPRAAKPFKEIIRLENERVKAVLPLNNFNVVEDYLNSLNKKARHNLRRDKKNILNQNPQIFINRQGDFENFIKLNQNKHAEDSVFIDERQMQSFANLLKISQNTQAFQVRIIAVEIGQKIAGVDFVIIYKNTYYPMCSGNDIEDFPGIGSYLNLYNIEDALSLGLERVDFLECKENDYKLRLFPAQEQYKLELK